MQNHKSGIFSKKQILITYFIPKGGRTNTEKALQLAKTTMFNQNSGARLGVPKVNGFLEQPSFRSVHCQQHNVINDACLAIFNW